MSISRRIRREAKANPAKAGALLGLLALAVYFWAPLIWGWIDTGTGARTSPPPAGSKTARVASSEATPAANDKSPEPTWQEIQHWQSTCPLACPFELASLRDPFRPVESGEEGGVREENDEEQQVSTPEEVVASVDMQLTGTIIGPRRRVALLDGRAYREGDVVVVDHLGTSWELEIRKIEADRVVLGWQAIERELTPPQRPQVGRIERVGPPR